MFTFLRVPWAKTCTEVVNVAKHRITSIKNELGKEVSIKKVCSVLIEGFQNALSIQLLDDRLTPYEHELAEAFCKRKYGTDDWNYYGRFSQSQHNHSG
jgi:lipoate-protein ligase A